MANALYDKFKEKVESGSIDLTTDTIKIALVKNTYTFSQTHEFASDVGDANIAGTFTAAQTIGATKTVTNGTFKSTTTAYTFTAVNDGTVNAYLIYKDTGVLTSSPLIAYIDSATEFPITTNGGDITLNENASGFFKI